jgi:hypothetical protein
MEEKPTFKIGDRVEQMCLTCNEERGHVVASVSKGGKITRVSCPRAVHGFPIAAELGPCSQLVALRPGANLPQGTDTFAPTFGEGEVTAIIEPRKSTSCSLIACDDSFMPCLSTRGRDRKQLKPRLCLAQS